MKFVTGGVCRINACAENQRFTAFGAVDPKFGTFVQPHIGNSEITCLEREKKDMEPAELRRVQDFIWNIADDVLRDIYSRGKYRDVILPMTVLRRIDAVLEPTKKKVRELSLRLDNAGVSNKHDGLCGASGQAFYNVS